MAPLGRVRPGLSGSLTDAIEQARAVDPNARQDSIALFRAQLIGGRQAPPIRDELPRAA
jgi:hypothetical protein